MSGTRPQFLGPTLVGAVLGNYRIKAEISTGGMGTVYRAEHELLGRPAAVKLLRPELSSSQVHVERFFNEAKAATAIRHPGIVEVYDFGYADDGRAYLVMELLEGMVLAKRVAQHGRLPELEAATIARGIASALKAAHGKGIFHRDLKPDNIFLVPDPDGGPDRVKVLDFGVAKLADAAPSSVRHTQTGALMGTPLYMAPEQARAASTIDHRADLYSLGCMLYEMLVGKPPFIAEGAGEIIALQLFAPPEPPSARLPSISPELERIVMRLLAKEPHERFQSAKDVIDALAAVIGPQGYASGPVRAVATDTEASPIGHTPHAPAPIPSGGLRLNLSDEAPATLPEKRSSMPIIAAVLTLVIAGAVGAFVLTRTPDATPAAAEVLDAGSGSSLPATATPAKPKRPTPARASAAARDIPIVVDDKPKPKQQQKQKAPAKQKQKETAKAPKQRAADPQADGVPTTSPGAVGGDPASSGPVTHPERSPGPTTDKGSPIDLGTDLVEPAKEP